MATGAKQQEEMRANAEWRFLARRVLMLCRSIETETEDSDSAGSDTREVCLQGEAFRERRDRALDLMGRIREGRDRPAAHLEDMRRLVSGLECSQTFFGSRRSA